MDGRIQRKGRTGDLQKENGQVARVNLIDMNKSDSTLNSYFQKLYVSCMQKCTHTYI